MLAAATDAPCRRLAANRSPPHDSARLADLQQFPPARRCRSRARQWHAAISAPSSETFWPAGHDVPERALYGNWRCRQMKLGGMTDYAVFSWFPCRISKVNGGIWFEKAGHPAHGGHALSGKRHVDLSGRAKRQGEPLHRYSGNGASVGAAANPDDQVGVLVGIGNNRLRIDCPRRRRGIRLRRDRVGALNSRA